MGDLWVCVHLLPNDDNCHVRDIIWRETLPKMSQEKCQHVLLSYVHILTFFLGLTNKHACHYLKMMA